jgi:hypothetical protein
MLCLAEVGEGVPMGTAFTYQGRLIDANYPAEGTYGLQFKLFDSPSDGNQIDGDVNKPDVDVIDGYFTVELDFGSVFDGNAVWLDIGIRPGDLNDPNTYDTLSPRQQVTPTPYALHARWVLVDEIGDNAFVGESAGHSNTTGIRNSAMGANALRDNTTGYRNAAMGSYTLERNTTGYRNSAVGSSVLVYNTTGYYNSATGCNALFANTTGNSNSALGYRALLSNTTGSYNSAVGAYAGYSNSSGNNNTFVGNEAGRDATGSSNVFLGNKAGFNETSSDKLYIANGADDSNVLIYGDFDTGKIGIGTTSPAATVDVNGTLALGNGPAIDEFSTDGTLADNSDSAVPTEQAVKTYVDSKIVSGGVGVVPVGGVVAWLKSFPHTPALTDNFVECNGQTLNDANSIYDGQTIPNLNGEHRFLQGDLTSGTTGGSLDKSTGGPSSTDGGLPDPHQLASTTHTHSIDDIRPPYYAVVWIMRVK